MEKFKTVDHVYIVFILLGLSAVINSGMSAAFVSAVFASFLGYRKWLELQDKPDIEATFKKQIDELKSQVSSLAIKETVKMPSRSDEIRRMF